MGDVLLAPVDQQSMPAQYGSRIYKDTDPNFVYLTSDKRLGESYAARHKNQQLEVSRSGGDLYLVRPVGEARTDPDYDHVPGLSIACERAVIQQVCARQVVLTVENSRYAASFMTWDDGSKMYDAEGFILPTNAMRQAGLTPTDFRQLGLDAAYTSANIHATRLLRERQQPR